MTQIKSYALSIRQPWAWAILSGGKDTENRDWDHPPTYRGTLIVHAGKQREPRTVDRDLSLFFDLHVPVHLPTGAFLGTVQLVGAHRVITRLGRPACCDSPWAMPDAGVHLELADPQPFAEPIFGRGQLGLWRPNVTLPIGDLHYFAGDDR